MKRVILDTNIYGRTAVDNQRSNIRGATGLSKILVHGSHVIRKELMAPLYSIVNSILKLKIPGFIGYEEFKIMLRRSPL